MIVKLKYNKANKVRLEIIRDDRHSYSTRRDSNLGGVCHGTPRERSPDTLARFCDCQSAMLLRAFRNYFRNYFRNGSDISRAKGDESIWSAFQPWIPYNARGHPEQCYRIAQRMRSRIDTYLKALDTYLFLRICYQSHPDGCARRLREIGQQDREKSSVSRCWTLREASNMRSRTRTILLTVEEDRRRVVTMHEFAREIRDKPETLAE